ncbi:hypothetical protein LCGC14_0749090 [marine sediment metagenome]|uniref:Uncharacterized protein n=1 Tax=marine sediment metagenome TaxID=412755 RepID=A0A0F9Q8Q9_9ZZZZ
MRKLNLKDYQYTEKVHNPIIGGVKEYELPFNVKDSILNILFLPALKLAGAALVKQNVLAIKIEQSEDEVLLTEDEYQKVLTAANTYIAQGRCDVELIDRILNQTPEVEV